MSRILRLILPVLLLGLVAGCSSGLPRVGGADEAQPVVASYVALGDSFTSAPFVPVTDLAGGCFRSSGNYPSLVAERLHVADFTDASCSGATTTDLLDPQSVAGGRGVVPPQLVAVEPDTELVTVGIGGNDFDLFATLVGECLMRRGTAPRAGSCLDRLSVGGMQPLEAAGAVQPAVERVVTEVRRRAPGARVVVVGYPQILDPQRRCGEVPLTREERRGAAEIEQALNRSLSRAAAATDADFVDMYSASAGHGICSADPWVNGPRTDRARALAFHPFSEGMEAVAAEVVELLRTR